MVFICSYPHCRNKSRFKLPSLTKNPEIRQKWIDFIGIQDLNPSSRKGLCESHFTLDQFIIESKYTGRKLDRKRLKNDAVPTILDPRLEEDTRGVMTSPDDCGSGTSDVPSVSPVKRARSQSLDPEDRTDKIRKIKREPSLEPDNIDDGHASGDQESEHLDEKTEGIHWLTGDNYTTRADTEELDDNYDEESSADNYDIHHLCEVTEETLEERSTTPLFTEPEEEPVCQEIQNESAMHEVRGTQTDPTSQRDRSVQTKMVQGYTIHDIHNNNAAILHFTGLENYQTFQFVLASLGAEVHSLKYKHWQVQNVAVEDQLYMTLWKLRRNTPDFELSFHFKIGKSSVHNIIQTWIPFMANQWRKLDIWPSKELVDYCTPGASKKDHAKTRIIIDEAKMGLRRSTGTSDRQVMEHSDIAQGDHQDVIMTGKGPSIQDILASYHVHHKIPNFSKGKNLLDGVTLVPDRKLGRHRVHIDRLIGCLKTFQILRDTLNNYYVKYADDIISICLVLCNLRESIMNGK